MGIPIKAIFDIDFLLEENKFQETLKAFESDFHVFKADLDDF